MSRCKLELCSCVVKEIYGELVEKVAMFIVKNGPSQLKTVIKCTGCSAKQVRPILSLSVLVKACSYSTEYSDGR